MYEDVFKYHSLRRPRHDICEEVCDHKICLLANKNEHIAISSHELTHVVSILFSGLVAEITGVSI